MADHPPKDSKIPLLTEVYQPKVKFEDTQSAKQAHRVEATQAQTRQNDPTLGITPEFIARVTSHVRPRLEAEITQAVLESVRDAIKKDLIAELKTEVNKAQVSLEANTANFIDRTKADLKTELPRMYQASADLVHVNLSDKIAILQTDAVSKFDGLLSDVLQTSVQAASDQVNAHVEALQFDTSARLTQNLNEEMQSFQAQLLSEHQAQLGQQFNSIFESTSQNAQQEIQQQTQLFQADAITQMQGAFTESMPAIYSAVVTDEQAKIMATITEQLQLSLQAFQAQSLSEHQAQLGQQLASTFESINLQAKADLQQHLQTIQADAISQMQIAISDAMPSIYGLAADEVKLKFTDNMTAESLQVREQFLETINADLPVVQRVLQENIQQILAAALPTLENDLRKQLTMELQDLLLKVKFVLPH